MDILIGVSQALTSAIEPVISSPTRKLFDVCPEAVIKALLAFVSNDDILICWTSFILSPSFLLTSKLYDWVNSADVVAISFCNITLKNLLSFTLSIKSVDIEIAFEAIALAPFTLLFNLNSILPLVVEEPDGTILKSQLSSEPLALNNFCSFLVLVVLNINSTPFGWASFEYQSNANLSSFLDKFKDLSCSFFSLNETLPFTFFNPLSKSFLALLVTIDGLCSSEEPPYSVNLKESVSYP